MQHDRQSELMGLFARMRESALLRLVALGGLVLILLIPIGWIDGLVSERMARRAGAVAEVSGKWGGEQTVSGPVVVVPYEHRWIERGKRGATVPRSETRYLTIAPAGLEIAAKAISEERYRGIFSVPVYDVELQIRGSFDPPVLAATGIDPARLDWTRSVLAVGISDVRAIQSRARVRWGDDEIPFQPGPFHFDVTSGIHAPIGSPLRATEFSFELRLHGSGGLFFTAAGRETGVQIESDWSSPSFQGHWIPNQRSVGEDGFDATWRIPDLGHDHPPIWTSRSDAGQKLARATFGVMFITPLDAHRMARRSVKYAVLFVVLTFGTLWLIDVLTGVKVHPIQYLLIGFALCTFFLLELSLAEHLGFSAAYLIGSGAVALLVGFYSWNVLKKAGRAVAVTAVIAALYSFLFVLLTNEDYALVLGALGLFAALAIAMFATRRIDWYSPVGAERPHSDPARV